MCRISQWSLWNVAPLAAASVYFATFRSIGLTEARRSGNDGLAGTMRTSSRIEPPMRL